MDLFDKAVSAVKDLGLPTVLVLILLLGMLPVLNKLSTAVNYSSWVSAENQRYLEAVRQDHTIMAGEHREILNALRQARPTTVGAVP